MKDPGTSEVEVPGVPHKYHSYLKSSWKESILRSWAGRRRRPGAAGTETSITFPFKILSKSIGFQPRGQLEQPARGLWDNL